MKRITSLDFSNSFIIAFILFAVYIAQQTEQMLRKKDPGMIVIDEIAGLMVTLAGVPFNLKTALAGFVIFRVFDIQKPFPIRILEKKVGGGSGIVLDDVLATRSAFYGRHLSSVKCKAKYNEQQKIKRQLLYTGRH